MREIKFRAWGPNCKMMWNWEEVKSIANKLGWENFTEGERVLMQYTGLKVFDDIEVFEGDKLSFAVFDCFGNDKQYEGYVVYEGSRFLLWAKPDYEFYGDDGGFDLDWVLSQDDEAKITGNIHQLES